MSGQFDTSGFVEGVPQGVRTKRFYWSDLSPFVQGYVEAMFSGCVWADTSKPAGQMATPYGFSDLAPETLARIMEDCDEIEAMSSPEVLAAVGTRPGRETWELRQRGAYPTRFPPLTVYLGKDGKVHLKAAPLPQGDE